MPKLPVTIAILTRNSGDTLGRALDSVKSFDDVLICDGGSTDNTHELARMAGARIIPQDPRYLAPDGRIADFAGVRNQTLDAARHQWFFFLDSDEYLSDELVEELARTVQGEPGAYWVPRKYVYGSTVIDCSVTYPSQQMRLFHRSVAQRFVKPVHERIELREGVSAGRLSAPMLVPVPSTAAEQKDKWRRYLAIERARRPRVGVLAWSRLAGREAAIGILFAIRLVRIQLLCRGTTLPISFELARLWYQWRLVADLSAIMLLSYENPRH